MKPLHFRWLTLPGIQEEMDRAAKAWSAFQGTLFTTQHLASAISLALALFSLMAPAWSQQSAADQGVPVQMIVTLEPKHTKVIPEITQQDVMVYQGHDRRTVMGWVPAKGDKAGLALAILIDDSAGFSLGSQLSEIRTFIQAQAPTTLVAVGYMQNGTVFMAQNFTQDHTAAAKSVRLAQGFYGAEGSPYLSLSEFIKRWNADPAVPRREVLMVTSGIDNVYMGVLDNPYVDAAIQEAQCAGIVIYSIYTPSAGHMGHSYFRTSWGQNYLSEITEATGGEAYDLLGPQGAVSFAPYFKQVNEQLPNQFVLTFLAKPQKKAGTESVKVTSEIHDVDFVHADKVCVPASPGE